MVVIMRKIRKDKPEQSLVERLLERDGTRLNKKVYEKYLKLEKMPIPNTNQIKLLRLKNGIYYGGVDDEDRQTGLGALMGADGTIFEGYYLEGMRVGKGRLVKANGELYIGDFNHEGIVSGEFHKDSFTYIGNFSNDVPERQGKEIYQDGGVFIGEFSSGFKVRQGEHTFPDGAVVSGRWGEDGSGLEHGEYRFTEEHKYKGDFKDGQFNGLGCYEWPGKVVYEGEFFQNKRQGEGRISWSDGSSVKGTWTNDCLDGFAEITYEDGTIKSCIWGNGEIEDAPKIPSVREPQVPPSFNYGAVRNVIGLSQADKARAGTMILDTFFAPLKPNSPEPAPVHLEEPMEEVKAVEESPVNSLIKLPPRRSSGQKQLKASEEVKAVESPVNSLIMLPPKRASVQKQLKVSKEVKQPEVEVDKDKSFSLSGSDDELAGGEKLKKRRTKELEFMELRRRDSLPKKQKLRRGSVIREDLKLRTEMSEEERLNSLNNLDGIISRVNEPVIAAQVIGVRGRPGDFEYGPPEMNAGFSEWTKLQDDSYYKGEWSTTKKRLGRGVHLKDGVLYEGGWRNDLRTGLGREIDMYADLYIGYWTKDVKNGFGKLQREDGYSYIGDWHNNVPDGLGIETTHLGTYEGNFASGLKSGKGTLRLKRSTSFKGNFEYGKINGYGVLTQDSCSYAGIWVDNCLLGKQVKVTKAMYLDPSKETFNPHCIEAYFAQHFPKYTSTDMDSQEDDREFMLIEAINHVEQLVLVECVEAGIQAAKIAVEQAKASEKQRKNTMKQKRKRSQLA
jgi:hypothetical protein